MDESIVYTPTQAPTNAITNENTTVSRSWVMGTLAAKSWPLILSSSEPSHLLHICTACALRARCPWTVGFQLVRNDFKSPSAFLSGFTQTPPYFRLREGRIRKSHSATSKDASGWLLLALLGQAYPYSSVRRLYLWRRDVCADSFMYLKTLIVSN